MRKNSSKMNDSAARKFEQKLAKFFKNLKNSKELHQRLPKSQKIYILEKSLQKPVETCFQ